jgi:hypothetical protein
MPPVTTYPIEGKTTLTNGKGDTEYCIEVKREAIQMEEYKMEILEFESINCKSKYNEK